MSALARLGPTPLVPLQAEQRKRVIAERTQEFFAAQLTALAARSARPLVICEANTARSHWSWLNDNELNPENITIAHQTNAQVAWPQVRMVRVRADNSPKVLWEKVYTATTVIGGRELRYEAPSWAEAQLFGLSEAADAVFLSFGSFISKVPRGVSGYRAMLSMKRGKNRPLMSELRKPHHDAWPTPRGLEVTVIRGGGAPAAEVAALVEWLRQCSAHYAGWMSLPAPLSFGSVFRAHLADYAIDEAEAGMEDPAEDEFGEAGFADEDATGEGGTEDEEEEGAATLLEHDADDDPEEDEVPEAVDQEDRT